MSKPVTENLFSFSGRRNRKSYIFAMLMWLAVLAVIWVAATVVSWKADTAWPLVFAGVASIPSVVSSWTCSGQRCRDFGWTGWAVLISLIPYVGVIFTLAIMFVPGTLGVNRYGPDPVAPG